MQKIKTIPVIKSAIYYYYAGLVNFETQVDNRYYFKIDEDDVVLTIEPRGTKMSCTCQFCSLKGLKYETLCGRKIAALIWLYHNTPKDFDKGFDP